MNRRKTFLKNALLIVTVTFVLKLVWMAFRVVVSNKVGAECMGLYQLTLSVYSLAVTFSTSGIHFASVRLITRAMAENDFGKVSDVLKKSVIYCLAFGITAFLLLFFFSGFIGAKILGDIRTVPALKALAICLPFSALSAVFSGYFSAIRKVSVTLVSRIIEQISEILLFFVFVTPDVCSDIQKSAFYISLSSSISIIFGTVFIGICLAYFLKDRHLSNVKGSFKEIISISLACAFGAYLRSGLQTVENVLVPMCFRKNGASVSGALSGYGMLCSMVMPVLFFPSFVLSAFSMLIIPEFTEAQKKENNKEIHNTSILTVRITLLFGYFVSAYFIVFGKNLGETLYHTQTAGKLISTMAPLVPFLYLDSVADGMLKGLGEYTKVVKYSSIDSAVSILLILLLVPKFGLYGYIVVIYVSSGLNAILSIGRLLKISENRVKFISEIVLPFSCALLCALASKTTMEIINVGTGKWYCIIGLVVALFIFYACIMLSNSTLKEAFLTSKALLNVNSHFGKLKRINNKRSNFFGRGDKIICKIQSK